MKIVDGSTYLEQVRQLIREYTETFGRSLLSSLRVSL